jgi:hypothetical protein
MRILEDNDRFTFWEEENIFCCRYKKHFVDLETAKMTVAVRLKVSDNESRKLFVDMTNVRSVSQAARDYYATEEAMHLAYASAAFTPSIIAKIIATFFLNFNKPGKPFKIFSNKEKAFEWLKGLNG